MRVLGLVYAFPLLAAALGAPMSFVLAHHSQTDPSNLYLVLGTEQILSDLLAHPDVSQIGPYSPPFSRLVTTTPELHTSLVDRNYWTVPATALAELCGIEL